MLFLLRPRQTWMPYAVPRDRAQQDVYNQQLRTGVRVDPPGRARTRPSRGGLAVAIRSRT